MTTAVTIAPSPILQFWNNQNQPCVGGSVLTQVGGINTATYQDSAGATPLPNPIPLNNRGEVSNASGVSCQLFIASGVAYTFTLFDAAGNQLNQALYVATSNISAPGGSASVGFVQVGTGAVARFVQDELRETVKVTQFDTLAHAITAAQGLTLEFPPGAYAITATQDFGTATPKFKQGALITVTAGVNVTIRQQVEAGNYQIFSATGNIMCAGRVNPMWWGAVPTVNNVSSPGVSAANTLAFRRAAKSFFADYNLIAGSIAAPGNGVPFSLCIPAGVWDLSNGFAAAVGIKVSGDSSSITLLRRLTANFDGDTAIPLLTIGQSLAAAPGLAYQNDATAGQSLSPFTASGAGESAAMASDLYFIDQNATVGAFAPRYPGAQFRDLFFTSCGLGINFASCADLTATNIVIDQGLTGISFGSCQNIRLTNTILYNQASQAVAIGSSVYDCLVDVQIEYPQGIAINVSGSNIQNLKFPNLNITQNASTGTNQIVVAAAVSSVDIEFPNAEIRNLGACAAVSIGAGTTTTVLRFKSATFDGNRTNTVYNQNTNMQALSVSSGTVILEDVEMRNMGVRSIFANTAALIVRGLRYSGMGTAASVFDLSACTGGDAEFFDVKGDGTVPLFTSATGSATVRVKGSSDWLGAPFLDGSFWSWNVPLPGAGQLMATVTAATDGTANLRKSATVLYEVSVEILPAITQTILSATLFASPLANGHSPVAPTLVFSGNTTTQVVGAVAPTAGKLRVPTTYSNMVANLEYMA